MAERFRAFAATYLVLIKDEKILLLLRKNTGYQDGNYSVVSGHLDGGETAKRCMIREAKEEAGINLSEKNVGIVHIMHRLAPDREYFDIYLTANNWNGEIVNMEPKKCEELKWFNLNSLPQNMVPEVKLALENIKNNIHFSEFGWNDNK